MFYARVSLSSSRLCHVDTFGGFVAVWFDSMPMRLFSDVTTRDASLWCWLLHAYLSLFRSMRWYVFHACLYHPLAFYVFLYACLNVYVWVLLVSVSSILQHNEVMDIQSKPTFVPHGHNLLCFLAYLPFCLFVCFLACLLAMPIMFTCFMPFRTLFASFPSIALQVSCLCLYFYAHGARTHRARVRFPKHKQKGRGRKHVDISQAAIFSRFRSLVFPIWLCTLLYPLPSSPFSLLDGYIMYIMSCTIHPYL